MSVDDPAVYCLDQVRRFDNDRYLTALFAAAAARQSLLALYAFNVEVARVRETVSEPLIGQMRLQWWRDTLDEMARGSIRQHPVALRLAEAIATFDLPRDMFERLLRAREFDLDDAPPADFAALETYADATSATLTTLAARMLGGRGSAVERAARHVGIAWALVGLLRAVPFHAHQRRLYLPADRLATHGIEPEMLFEGRGGAGLATLAKEFAAKAHDHLAAARALHGDVPRPTHAALLPGVLADFYLRRLARRRYELFDPELQRRSGARALRLAIAYCLGRY